MSDHDVDLAKELGKLVEVLRREVNNLMSESTKGKLGPAASNDLRLYLRLLLDLGDRQEGAAEAEAAKGALADSGDAPKANAPAGGRRPS